MNLYLRYFDNEILVPTADEAIRFLSSIEEIMMDESMEREIREYVASDVFYPKRYKVRPRIYFIIIKTEAKTMADFKQKKALRTPDKSQPRPGVLLMERLVHERFGWYEGTVDFKRVIVVPDTGKCEYHDTTFTARVKANSGKDCYNRIIEHLSARVDRRSQFPSVKGDNYRFKFLGTCK